MSRAATAVLPRLARAALDRRVEYLILFVTARCNLLCRHCFYTEEIQRAKAKRELTADEYRRIAERAGGVLQVSLTGGEPFLRKDLDEILLAFHEAGTLFFNVTTNGLQPDATVARLEAAYARAPDLALRLGISLDGFEPTHDRLRGRAGGYRRALETIAALEPLRKAHPRLTVHVSTTLTRDNKGEILDFIDHVRGGIPVDAHYLGVARGKAMDPSTLEVAPADYARAVERLGRRWVSGNGWQNLLTGVNALMNAVNREVLETGRFVTPCVAAEKMVTIDEEGRVKPCEILEQRETAGGFGPYVLGDLRAHGYDLDAVLATEEARRIRRAILATRCRCTFECANQANVALDPRGLAAASRLYLKQRLLRA